mmetsp:Transcript_24807/g.38961  ORF Transcript_24807/g.38961 Transcript_24807/m.38961 type:complete len:182 (+) Transcript_24807:36-581(+)|eukprot:CAMPEP_0184310136 /NCGR_PEP_ID=MMETSP1049-20130417/24902_1 /TAXON_ID=77928 /ORGANISM="Proteomonas sulcata, Strain CCMP704" /LENGTH=181 /DNA_ID=CAMNT_0026623775 /DNA_START=58 /DNA_END=603 /DNA_ORIENTATION=+
MRVEGLRSLGLRVLLFLAILSCFALTAHGDEAAKEKVGLRSDDDIAKLREEALAKLETPLEKMKVKELKHLLTERGVTCTACSEKAQLVQTVKDNIHLPVKPETLKKMQAPPKQVEDEEMQKILAELRKKQEKENEIKEMLKKQGIDTSGINFGGNNMDPEMMAKIFAKSKGGADSKKDDL